jgi:outer membrane protein, multidrug efflux system
MGRPPWRNGRMPRALVLPFFLVAVSLSLTPLLSGVAFGQAPPVQTVPPLPTAPAPAPTVPSGVTLGVPPPPPVDDPMLAPVPPAQRVVATWAEALDLLRARNTTLKAAIDQVANAHGQTIVAVAQYLPALGGCAGGSSAPPGCANASFSHQLVTRRVAETAVGTVQTAVVPIPNTLTAGLTLSQDVLNVQEYDQIGINVIAEEQNRQTVYDTRRTLDLALASQLVAVVTAERSAEINRTGLRVALEQLELAKRKTALGAGTSLDIVRAQQNAANARASLVSGDETLRQAREALGLTLGIPEEIGVGREMNISGLADETLRSCRAIDSIDERPDIVSARRALDVARRNLRNTWYSFIPVVTAQSAVTGSTAVNVGYPNPTWSIGAALSIPIFDGGTRFGTIKSQEALEDVAVQQLEGLRRQAIIQVEQAKRGIEVADVSYKVAFEQRNLAAQNDEMTQTMYVRGVGTSVDLVTVSEAHRLAEQSLVVAEFNMVKARLAAILALSTCPW